MELPDSSTLNSFMTIRCGDGYRSVERVLKGLLVNQFSKVEAEPKRTIIEGTKISQIRPVLSLL